MKAVEKREEYTDLCSSRKEQRLLAWEEWGKTVVEKLELELHGAVGADAGGKVRVTRRGAWHSGR